MAKFRTVAAAKKQPGRYNAGDSLYLVVRGKSALWEHQYREAGTLKTKSYGSAIGAAPVSFTQARTLLWADRLERRNGRQIASNAKYHRLTVVSANGRSTAPVLTLFAAARDQYFTDMQGGETPQWTPEQLETIKRMLAKHAAKLDAKPVGNITRDDMADLLRPIWKGPGSHTGNRVRGLAERILRSAGIKNDDNPALWENLQTKLSNKIPKSVPRASLPFADLPALMRDLAANETMQAKALRFMILTGTRQDETLEATWGEFDLAERTWTIPAERMKMADPHTVPLSDGAIAILKSLSVGKGASLVFPSKLGTRIAQQTTRELVKELRPDVKMTPHGFRASLATWAQEQDNGRKFPAPIIDAAGAHYTGNATTKAYQRSKLLAPRVELMADWCKFATGR